MSLGLRFRRTGSNWWLISGLLQRMLVGLLPRARKPVTGWLCWQSAANPSLPANMVNTGRIRQRAGKTPNCPCRTSQHLNDLDGFLPALTSRENLVRSRDAGDISFRKSGTSALPLKADILGMSTEVRYVPIADVSFQLSRENRQ